MIINIEPNHQNTTKDQVIQTHPVRCSMKLSEELAGIDVKKVISKNIIKGRIGMILERKSCAEPGC
jgi:hypothetical protein